MEHVVPRIVQVVLDSRDARRAAEFWRELLGLSYRAGQEPPPAGEDDPDGRDWLNLRSADGAPVLAFQQSAGLTPSTWPSDEVPQQIHLDLSVPDGESLEAVHQRVLSLGGRELLDRTDDEEEPLWVFADPDGHPFCVFVRAG